VLPASGGTSACEHLSTKADRSHTKSAYRLLTDVSALARNDPPDERVRTCLCVYIDMYPVKRHGFCAVFEASFRLAYDRPRM
jgi:hypothetical protein